MKKILIFNALLLLVSAVSAQKISFPVEELRVDTLRSRTGTAVVSVHPLEVADGLTVYSAGAPRLFLVEAVDSSGFRRFGVTMNGALIAGTNHDTEVNIDGLAMVGRYNALKGADAFAVGKGIINNADTAMALGYHYTIPENKRNVTVIGYGSNRIEMSADSGRFIGNWHKYAQVNSDWNASGGISQILNKPTTITGYGITDAYTQTQTRTLVGDTASVLRELIKSGVPESDPVWTAEKADYYTRTDMQTSGQSQVHWNNITNKPSVGAGSVTSVGLSMPDIFSISGSPVTGSGTLTASLAGQTQASVFAAPATANGVPTFRSLAETDIPNLNWTKITSRPTTLSGYGVTDAYTQTQTRTLVGDTASVLRELIKSGVQESDPVWTAEKADYYTKTDMQTSGQSQMHWDNITNKPTIPEAQVNADWDATDGVAQILNKPTIPEEYTLPVATASTLGGVKVVSGLMDSGNAGLLTNLPRLGVYKYHPVNGGDISVFPGGGGNFTSGFDWWDNISGFPGDGLYCFKIIHACYSIDYTQWYMKEETVMCMPEGMVARLSVSENANTENHLKISDVQWVDVGINTGMYTLKFEYSGTSSTGITGNWMYRVRVLLLENYSGELQ